MKRNRGLVMAAILAGVAATTLSCSASHADPSSGRVDGAAARKLVAEGAKLVDVRTAAEFSQGHIEGAVLIPFDEISARSAEVGAKDKPVVLYCRSGRRSAIAREKLISLGFTAVYDLGSKTAW